MYVSCADTEGGQGVRTPPEKTLNFGVLSDTGPVPLKNHKATMTAFNVGPSSARQPNAIKMAFCWRADDGLLLVLFGSSLLSSKTNPVKVRPPLAELSAYWYICT